MATKKKADERQDPAEAKKLDTAVQTEEQPEPVQETVPDEGTRQHTALGVTYNVTDDKGFRRA